ncbi:hypothetical protein R3P38DRAFT_2783550 [Favolaschia claudopus]|uniref:Uncharacterized protein n=1 Tax=Favolaschia claudopus TaxID=2862362 RepID=A0AAW0AZT8_9AGAR
MSDTETVDSTEYTDSDVLASDDAEVEWRVRDAVEEEGINWDLLGPALRRYKTIITGSTLHPVFFKTASRRTGVDLCTPLKQEEPMAFFIENDLTFAESSEPVGQYPGYAGFVRVRRFHKDEHTIYLIVVADDNAATIIFNFYSTLDMNFVSGYGLFCAYPELTLNKLSTTNPSAFDTSLDGSQFRRINAKIRNRGFTHNNQLCDHSDFRDHVCGTSKSCPSTLRSMHDSGTLFVPFESTLTQAPTPTIYDGVHSIIWSLGGRPCRGEGLFTGLVVFSVPIFEAQVSITSPKQVLTLTTRRGENTRHSDFPDKCGLY